MTLRGVQVQARPYIQKFDLRAESLSDGAAAVWLQPEPCWLHGRGNSIRAPPTNLPDRP